MGQQVSMRSKLKSVVSARLMPYVVTHTKPEITRSTDDKL